MGKMIGWGLSFLAVFLLFLWAREGCANKSAEHQKQIDKEYDGKMAEMQSDMAKHVIDENKKITSEVIEAVNKNASNSIESANQNASNRITEIQKEERSRYDSFLLKYQEAERNRFDSMLTEVTREKYSSYALFIGGVLLALALFFNLVFALTPLNLKMLLFPSKYEVVDKEDAELIRFLKSYILSKKKLNPDHLLTKDECIDIFTKNESKW